MLIRILPTEIVKNISTEDELLDQSTIESIYEIRTLKVAVELDGKTIEIHTKNDHGQVYIDSHKIWLKKGTWIAI